MNPQNPRYFIIIVHYGANKPTERLIQTILQSTLPLARLIVVDHADSPYPVAGDKKILVIRPVENAGYAAGINIGLGVMASLGSQLNDRLIILNNDLALEPVSFDHIHAWWEHQTDSAWLAGWRGGTVNRLTGRSRIVMVPPYDYIDGSVLAASYTIFLRLKGLPDQYFLYWEDVALGLKANQLGLSLCTIDGLTLTHDSAGSQHKLYYLVRNGAHLLAYTGSLSQRLYWRLLNRLRYVYHGLLPTTASRTQIREVLRDALRNQLGKRQA